MVRQVLLSKKANGVNIYDQTGKPGETQQASLNAIVADLSRFYQTKGMDVGRPYYPPSQMVHNKVNIPVVENTGLGKRENSHLLVLYCGIKTRHDYTVSPAYSFDAHAFFIYMQDQKLSEEFVKFLAKRQ